MFPVQEESVVVKRPESADYNLDSFVLSTDIACLQVSIPNELLEAAGKAMTPMGIAIYVGVVYLLQHGRRVTPDALAEFLAADKRQVKYYYARLKQMGVFDELKLS